MNTKLLTVKQAAETLGVSAGLVYELVAARRIAHERHGLGRGKILIPLDSIQEYRLRQTIGVQLETNRVRPRRVKLKHLKV